jgi:ubiquinone/menaquinone biosynthesis C-methylase UbiE
MQRRTLTNCAPFLLRHLRSGMTVLDCGCGAGSMTLELAERVAPGEVVGLDMEPSVLDQARALASERGTDNVRFEQGNVYALPYADDTFDVLYSHALMSHLHEPAALWLRCGGY